MINKNIFAFCVVCSIGYASAQEISPLEELQKELSALKEIQAETNSRIRDLELKLLNDLEPKAAVEEVVQFSTPDRIVGPGHRDVISPILFFNSDLALRYETNYEADTHERTRHVMRARLHGKLKATDQVMIGALLETGDPNDPNSGYVTLSDFADDLDISLSRIYAQWTLGNVTLYGGKFPKPFYSTDLLWDGDVNLAGYGAKWKYLLGENSSFEAAGIYSVIDEAATGPDSSLVGGQIKFNNQVTDGIDAWIAAAFYDYEISSIESADSGDFRSNLRTPNGTYQSDFDIVDIIIGANFEGFSSQWPLSIKGNYVINKGAESGLNTAFKTEIAIGQNSNTNDFDVVAGYSQAEVDAVYAAFSNDNLQLATNYQAYNFALNYTPLDHVKLNATLYYYKPLAPTFSQYENDWMSRLRLNLILSF